MKAVLWAALASLGLACTDPTDVEPPEMIDDAMPSLDARVDGGRVDGGRPDAVVDGAIDRGRANDAALDPDGAPSRDLGMPGDASVIDGGPPPCVERVLATNNCTDIGCHSPPVQAQLDLRAPGLAERLINAESSSCQGRVLIDPNDVSRSLLLQTIGAVEPPNGADDACQIEMPPGGGLVSAGDRACLLSWVQEIAAEHRAQMPPEPPAEYEPTTIESALRKVKVLLTGAAPTAEEMADILADPDQLRVAIEEWMDTPEFEAKLTDFLLVALQQRVQQPLLTLTADQFDDFRQSGRNAIRLKKVLEESFVRTAVDIVQRNVAFDRVLVTNQWMVTTANLVLLRYLEQTFIERSQTHTLNAADVPDTLGEQVQQHSWLAAGLQAPCDVPQTHMLSVLFGFVDARRHCVPQPDSNLRFEGVLTEDDFEDWRLVRFRTLAQAPGEPEIPFYDVPALRAVRGAQNILVLQLPRVGFFTTPTFLGNWATNPDNQFRVTTNQSVMGALHIGFAASERTLPFDNDAFDVVVDAGHAVPGTACYGCHRQLDPMRVYFARHFTTDYQRPRGDGAPLIFDPQTTASFAFRGGRFEGGWLPRFAGGLAEHPRFPIAWAQKLCLYANSARCDESDPAFVAIVDAFQDGGHNLRTLIIDLFSSPLVTGLSQTRSWHPEGPPISITRRAHLCALLSVRISPPDVDPDVDPLDVCGLRLVKPIIGLIPQDDFSRGAVDPIQPARPSAFHFAAAESVCEAVARSVVFNNPDAVFYTDDIDGSLDRMVSRLMALPDRHPRHMPARLALQVHYDAALQAEGATLLALRSALVVACLSPDVMGVGL